MVTVADDGLELVDDEIHAIAVGTGTGNEGSGADSLANEVYRSNKENTDCRFDDTGGTGESEGVIEVTAGGGTANVDPGTEIAEIGVFSEGGTLVVIDEFDPVPIADGHTEEFAIPSDYQR